LLNRLIPDEVLGWSKRVYTTRKRQRRAEGGNRDARYPHCQLSLDLFLPGLVVLVIKGEAEEIASAVLTAEV